LIAAMFLLLDGGVADAGLGAPASSLLPPAIPAEAAADARSSLVAVAGDNVLPSSGGDGGRLTWTFDGGRGDPLAADASQAPTSPDWLAEAANLASTLDLGPLGALDLSAAQRVRQDVMDDGRFALGRTLNVAAGAGAALTLPPVGILGSSLGASLDDITKSAWSGGESRSASAANFQAARVYYAASVRPLSGILLVAGARMDAQAANAALPGAEMQTRATAISPILSAALSLLPGADWRVAIERHVDPLDADAYLAAAGDRAAEGRYALQVTPNEDLRYAVEFRQTLPGGVEAHVNLAYRQDGDAVEALLVAPTVKAPDSVRLDSADNAQVSLSAPAPVLGRVGAVIETSADWTRSIVTDPLTATRRELSGEQPLQLKIGLKQTPSTGSFSWGVQGEAGGRRTYFGDGGALSVDAPPRWNAFVEYAYKPASVSLKLEVSGAAGAAEALNEGRSISGPQSLEALGFAAAGEAPQVSVQLKAAL